MPKSKQDSTELALIKYEREQFLKRANDALLKLKDDDPAAWQKMLDEAAEWDCTLMDGLEDEPEYPDPTSSL